MQMLPRPDLEKLIKIAGMFGSASEGERANAALLASTIVRDAGLTWAEVLAPQLPPPIDLDGPIPKPKPQQKTWNKRKTNLRLDIEGMLKTPDLLTPWEREFLANVRDNPSPPSPKQKGIVNQIKNKFARHSQESFV